MPVWHLSAHDVVCNPFCVTTQYCGYSWMKLLEQCWRKKYVEGFKAEHGKAKAAIICSWKQVAFNMSIHLRREGEL